MGARKRSMARSCKTSMKDYYVQSDFWLKPENHYWETDMYTEEGKRYLRSMVAKIKKNYGGDKETILNRNHF